MPPPRPLNFIRRPATIGGRDLLGTEVKGVAKGFVEESQDIATSHEDLFGIGELTIYKYAGVGGRGDCNSPYAFESSGTGP